MNKKRIALVTAGLGDLNFSNASNRLVQQAKNIYGFDYIVELTSENVAELCPHTSSIYKDALRSDVPGYGYWSWKPELIFRIASGELGQVGQIVWIDSGCEILANPVTRKRFLDRIQTAQDSSGWFHTLESSDKQYTKNEVIRKFPDVDQEALDAPQFQANYFHLNCMNARDLICEWYEYSRVRELMDWNISEKEDDEFIAHRSDQSLLSLIAKRMAISPNHRNLPAGNGFRSQIRGLIHPVWISRNRGGTSIIPKMISGEYFKRREM